jgi:uncharacterized protein RhaS with RHS repeats
VTRFKPDAGYTAPLSSATTPTTYSKVRYRYHFEKPAGSKLRLPVAGVEDANGNRLTLAYVNDTQLHSVTDAAGRVLTFTLRRSR